MPINPDAVGSEGEPSTFSWDSTSSILYALGVGAGMTDPTGFELEFTTENSIDVVQKPLPSMVVVLSLRSEMKGSGPLHALGSFNPAMLVHGEQSFTLHKPLTVSGTAVASSRIAAIYDKGKAAVVVLESTAKDPQSGEPLFTTSSSMFIRGEGGWGGDRGPSAKFEAPTRTPDHVVSYQTRPDQALLYRLNGDRNPLHADPKFAERVGFPQGPILHGLCSFGYLGRAVVKHACGGDPRRLRKLVAGFKKPVWPADTLTTNGWALEDGRFALTTSVAARSEVVLGSAYAVVAPAG